MRNGDNAKALSEERTKQLPQQLLAVRVPL
jgi:hypothetical protein